MNYKSKYLMDNHNGNNFMNYNLLSNIFYKKYIKYKKKYLDIKKSFNGGDNSKNITKTSILYIC